MKTLELEDVIRGIDRRVAFIIKELPDLTPGERLATCEFLLQTLNDCRDGVWRKYCETTLNRLQKFEGHDDMMASRHDRKEVNE